MAGQLTAGAVITDSLKASSGVLATQNGMTGIAKAWVNFQGGSGNTAGAINSSFNVSSVTATATGRYSINFTTTMANANYAMVSASTWDNTSNNNTSICGPYNNAVNTTSVGYVQVINPVSQATFNPVTVHVAFLGS